MIDPDRAPRAVGLRRSPWRSWRLGLTLLDRPVLPGPRGASLSGSGPPAPRRTGSTTRGAQGVRLPADPPRGVLRPRGRPLSAATSLGRQARRASSSPHLDVPTTVRPHGAGGRARGPPPPPRLGRAAAAWCGWTSSAGDHPLLWAVEAVCWSVFWTKEGLPFVRLNYAYSPELLTDPVTRPTLGARRCRSAARGRAALDAQPPQLSPRILWRA
jgi:hypothetical protein